MIQVIAYDLASPHDTPADYARVIDYIKSTYPAWYHIEKSVWLVDTNCSSTEVRDRMKKVLNGDDTLLVGRLCDWAGYNLSKDRVQWLHGRRM